MRIVCAGLILLGTMPLAAQSTAIALFEPTPLGRIWDQYSAGPEATQTMAPRFVTIPHIAAGGGWNTEFTAVNCSKTPQQVQIVFFSDELTALKIPLSGLKSGMAMANGALVSLQPMGVFTYQTNTDASSPAISGFAAVSTLEGDSVSINDNVRVFAVYRQHLDARQEDFEAAVPQFYPNEMIVFPFDNSNGYFTGIGLTNHSPLLVAVNVVIRDENGTTLWAGDMPRDARRLPPFHEAFLLRDKFPVTSGIRGTIQFSARTPTPSTAAYQMLAAIALRFSPTGPFTSLTPVYQGYASGFPYL
jgi:hypothetical protein